MPKTTNHIIITALFLIVTALNAQEENSSLTETELIAVDSLQLDSTLTDSSLSESELDTVVNYSAQDVDFTFSPRITILTGNAKISYKTMELTAHKIEVHWEDDLLYAEGRLDTVKLDSSLGGGDTLVWNDLPKMKDGSEIIDGHTMVYHMKSRYGKVSQGVTQYEDGLCRGTTIKKVDENVLNIRSGYYTTCEEETPHYNFWARDLKLVVKERIIARPIVLYFGPVPVMIFPFAVFPAGGGRHSGVEIPTYGESSSQGRFFRDLGYYWAPNDYFDVHTLLDFYERYGIQTTSRINYVKRYRFNGNISGSLTKKRFETRVEDRWRISSFHKHTLSPTMSLIVKGDYQSDASYQRDLSDNPYERMKLFMKSDALLDKRWAGTPYSGSITVNHYESLTTGAITQLMPSVGFSRKNLPLIPQPEDAEPEDVKWFHKFYFGYIGTGKRTRNVTAEEIRPSPLDSIQTIEYSLHPWRYKSGIKHYMTLSARQNILEYFALVQSLNYTENWFDEWLTWSQDSLGSIDSVKHEGFKARRTFSTSMTLSTTLYGLFHPGVFGIDALRHKIDPQISLSYSPDFSEPKWGYYDVFNVDGREIFKDRFQGNIYVPTPKNENLSLRISVGNLFQYKRLKDDQEIKGDLFDLALGTSHNFLADSIKWKPLTSLIRLSPEIGGEDATGLLSMISGFGVSLRGSHSFYKLRQDASGSYYESRESAGLPRLLDYNISASFSIAAREKTASADTSKSDIPPPSQINLDKEVEQTVETQQWKPAPIPWDASISFNYSEDHRDPDQIRKNITAGLRLSVQVTKNWDVKYNTNIDLHRRRVTLSGFTIHRDLHCWDGTLTWTPLGSGRGYYLRIGIRSSQLTDVKVEKRRGYTGVIGY